ncbi:hypothetical protein FRD00_03645 [Persicimonas caeni]|nr:hypothetical protein FRD00_03645 [Persicimonas caeni]
MSASTRRALLGVICMCCLVLAACFDGGTVQERDAEVTSADASDAELTPDAADSGPEDTRPQDVEEDVEPDSGPCGQTCAHPTPVCDEASGECVACLRDGDCTIGICSPSNECVDCYEDGQCHSAVCDVGAGKCVECLSDGHCDAPGAAKCSASNECVPCDDDSQCASVDGAGVCAGGTCVECTVDDETACGEYSCDPATNTCTQTERGTVGTCGKCKADSECVANHACIEMNFDGTALPDGYCLKTVSSGCSRPYGAVVITRASVSGAPEDSYCGIVESMTTCEAVVDLVQDTSCASNADCGVSGQDDGRCEQVGTLTDRCSYACSLGAQCPGSISCGGPTGDKYCGGS